jgi:hypothetical protein
MWPRDGLDLIFFIVTHVDNLDKDIRELFLFILHSGIGG